MGFAAHTVSDPWGSGIPEPKEHGPALNEGLHNKAAWEVRQDLISNLLLSFCSQRMLLFSLSKVELVFALVFVCVLMHPL